MENGDSQVAQQLLPAVKEEEEEERENKRNLNKKNGVCRQIENIQK
jgi:hypothetical protein